jgi:hypothetical protein
LTFQLFNNCQKGTKTVWIFFRNKDFDFKTFFTTFFKRFLKNLTFFSHIHVIDKRREFWKCFQHKTWLYSQWNFKENSTIFKRQSLHRVDGFFGVVKIPHFICYCLHFSTTGGAIGRRDVTNLNVVLFWIWHPFRFL